MIVVVFKGLYGAPETPKKHTSMRDCPRQRHSVVLDFRSQQNAELVNRHPVVQKVNGLMITIEPLVAGRNSANVILAIVG